MKTKRLLGLWPAVVTTSASAGLGGKDSDTGTLQAAAKLQ